MVHWFQGLFDDPAQETPHNSREGGYQYIWGGPYDASDELGSEFGSIVSDEVLERAIEEVESDGIYEWAPTSAHPDRKAGEDEAMADHYEPPPLPTLEEIRNRLEGGVVPSFGGPIERDERDALRREIADLRSLLVQSPASHGGVGHNQPPGKFDIAVELKIETTAVIDEIDFELAKDAPDVEAVVESAGRLQRVIAWVGKKLDKATDKFLGAIATAGGVAVAAELAGFPVAENLTQVFRSTMEWLNSVTMPF